MKKIRLLIVDDHFVVRIGLASALNLDPDMQVVAEAKNGREAVALYEQHNPDVVVMDYQLPELNGAEATAGLLSRVPAAFHTGVEDVLLAGLVAALTEWRAELAAGFLVDVEGHGRVTDDLDLSRTVGWFTGVRPVRLSAPEAAPAEGA